MARHRQPEALAELKGAKRHDPQRYHAATPKSDYGLGQPPDHLCEEAKAAWFELETYSLKGVLTGSDRLLMEVTSGLVAELRRCPSDFPTSRVAALIGCLARLGLTPADRQKLGTDKPPEGNPFEAF